MGPSAPIAPGFVTVAEAADELGIKPWDVIRLIQTGDLESLVLVQTASLRAAKENAS